MNNNTTFFDLPLGFYSWADNAQDYSLIAELIPKLKGLTDLVELLDNVNKDLPKDSEFFDGTISSLRYLNRQGLIDPEKIQNSLLKITIKKYFLQENGAKTSGVTVNPDRWSRQALSCKIVVVGIQLKRGKLFFKEGMEIFEDLKTLNSSDLPFFDDDIEKGRVPEESLKKLSSINVLWISLVASKPWNQNQSQNLAQTTMEIFVLSFFKDSFFYPIFEKLEPYVDKIAEKYFHGFHTKDHTACLAVRNALVIVMQSILEKNLMLPERRHPTLRVDGFLNKWIEYIFTENYEIQPWVINYLNAELEPRLQFIKQLLDEGLLIYINGKEKIIYLPIHDSFRFFVPAQRTSLIALLRIFHDQQISTKERDELAKKIVFQIQHLMAEPSIQTHKNSDEQKDSMKEAYVLLLIKILKPLIKKQTFKHMRQNLDIEKSDIEAMIDTETLATILKYDESKNSSFFGYISVALPGYILSIFRDKKTSKMTQSIDEMDQDQQDKLLGYDGQEDNIKNIENELLVKKIHSVLKALPQKEREAIATAFLQNKQLGETQRKAKNRGLQRLKKMFPNLKDLLE